MGFCDLHTHSKFSDGTDSPKEIIELAEKLSLSAVALTDHNTVSGLAEFLREAEGKQVNAVAGIEISTEPNECSNVRVALEALGYEFVTVSDLLRKR